MNNFVATVYDVLFQPGVAMLQIAVNRPLWQAFAVFMVTTIVVVLTELFSLRTTALHNIGLYLMVVQTSISMIWLIAETAILHLIAELLGGRGSVVGLLCTIAFAYLPQVLFAPLGVLLVIMPTGIGAVVAVLLWLVIAAWVISLKIAAIKGTYELPASKAVIIFITPMVVFCVGGLIMTLMIGVVACAQLR